MVAGRGATLAPATGKTGVVVQSVGSVGASRLRPGDVITAVDGEPVTSVEDVTQAFGAPEIGDEVRIRVTRGSRHFTLFEVPSPVIYLGANVTVAPGSKTGVVVTSLQPDSPAAASDLKPGDVIIAVDGTPIAGVDDVLRVIGAHQAGDRIKIRVARGSRQLDVTATLARRPPQGSVG